MPPGMNILQPRSGIMRKTLITLAAAGLLAMTPLRAADGAEEIYELSLAHPLNNIHPQSKYIAQWAEKLGKDSGGRLEIHIYDNNSLMKSAEMTSALKAGGLDMALLFPASIPADLPYASAVNMPFLTRDAREAARLYQTTLAEPEVAAELAPYCVPLFASGSDRNCLITTGSPILKPSDLAGKRVLIWGAPYAEEVRAWGGTPVMIPAPDSYLGLQRGMGEVLYGPIPMMISLKLEELAKHLTIVPSQTNDFVAVISRGTMESLPDDLQKLLRESAGPEFSRSIGQITYEACLADLDKLRTAGVQIHELADADLALFRETSVRHMRPYYVELLKKNGVADPDAWIDRVYALAARTGQ